jgi:hypothetical protein
MDNAVNVEYLLIVINRVEAGCMLRQTGKTGAMVRGANL